MKFELSPEQVATFTQWYIKLPHVESGAIGGDTTFTFTPTSLGVVIKAEHASGANIDLTEYKEW